MFAVHYQPIVVLSSGQIEGFEALARWTLADGTKVNPGEFIPLAEETGIIFDLEQQILRQVCADLTRWRGGIEGKMPYVSVNLSGKELANPSFPEQVRRILSEHRVQPGWLRFELTESAIVQNADVAADVLSELKRRLYGEGSPLDEVSPEYRQARQINSTGDKGAQSAFEIGQQIFNKDAQISAKLMRDFDESQRDAYVMGAAMAIRTRLGSRAQPANAIRNLLQIFLRC